jgi:putative redox protein
MVQIDLQYQGGLRCAAVHAPSQTQIFTDAPVDNHGRGESFSPTDLVATALGTCMLTIMGIYAEKNGIDLTGARVKVLKEMTSVAPRRIARLTTQMELPLPEDHPRREALERAALTCPVHESLHPDVEKPVHFIWQPPQNASV